MKNNFNTLRQYIYDNYTYECAKETIDGLFRAILQPLFNNLQYECTILLRLNDEEDKKQLLKRLAFSKVNLISFNKNENQKSNKWENVEFLVVIGQRYSSALIWDYDCAEKSNSAKCVIIYNSKAISDLIKRIAENSSVDFDKYIAERRQNVLLNQSIRKIVTSLNEKNEEIFFNQNAQINYDESVQTAQIVSNKAKFIAHEIKNGLSVINLYSKILDKRLEKIDADEETKASIVNALKCITNASENISSNISDLRCLSTPYITEINLNKVILNIVQMCDKKAKDAGVELELIPFDECIISTDKTKLECALTNIIYNAIEACNKGCFVQIETQLKENSAKILVKNNGAKIPEEIKEKIFEENFTTKEKGNGLGLGICKKQLEMVGGNIRLVSSDEKETVFEIVLPL